MQFTFYIKRCFVEAMFNTQFTFIHVGSYDYNLPNTNSRQRVFVAESYLGLG